MFAPSYPKKISTRSATLGCGIRQVSGRTVVEYINRLPLMESIWLLESTSLSINEIADRVGYADSTTFGRFFFRMKGVTSRKYRKSL
jgi:AraC-like DNA-binding protein